MSQETCPERRANPAPTADVPAPAGEPGAKSSPLLLPVVLAAQFVIPLSISGTAVALPLIAEQLGAAPVPLQAVVNGFNLAFAVCVLIWGVVADRIGFRTSFRIGAAVVAIAGVASALAPTLLLLDAARILAGIGAAAVLTGSTAILSSSLTGAARGRAFALFGAANGLGLALGPTIASGLIALGGWRLIFGAHAVVLALALAGTAAIPSVRPAGTPDDQRDLEGQAGTGRRALLWNRRFLALCLVPVAGSIAFVTLVTYLPGALGGVLAVPPTTAGVVMIAMTAPVVVGPILSAWLVRTLAPVTAMTMVYISLAALLTGSLGLLLLKPGTSVTMIIVPMLLVGFGFGLPVGMIDSEALGAVPARVSGTAAGVLNLFRIGSEAIAVAAYGWLLSVLVSRAVTDRALADVVAAGSPGDPAAYAGALGWLLGVIAGLVVLISAAILVLDRAGRRDR